ncbi:MAG: L-threonylcarbamoyladenylate synthase [Noviherbaspirillum sp.]
MSQVFQIHPDNPQLRLVRQVAQVIMGGGIVALPTDSCYSLVCRLDDKEAAERLRRVRGVDNKHLMTLLCRDLSDISLYARVDNAQYRLLKAATPGPYTVVLEATKELPRRLSHPSRKTIGLRIPEHNIVQALLQEMGQPLVGTTLVLPGQEEALNDPEEIFDQIGKQIELVVDGGACGLEPTTVVDLTGEEPTLVRQGCGDPAPFGL